MGVLLRTFTTAHELEEELMAVPAPRESGHTTSMSLLSSAVENDQEAWRRLTDIYGPLVYHWCRKSGLGQEDAADVFQDVFRSLVKHLPRFQKTQEGDRFRAWLWTITRNKIRDLARSRSGKAEASGGTDAHRFMREVPEDEPESWSSSEAAVTGFVRQTLDSLQREFQPQTWEAFRRVVMDGQSPAQVAEELSISADSVYQAKSRILRRLRQELGDCPQ